MIRWLDLLGVTAAVITLATFFIRALANWRSGKRVKRYASEIRSSADEELERLQAELEEARRIAEGGDSRQRKD